MGNIVRFTLFLGLVIILGACKKQSTLNAEAQREREARIIADWLAENRISNFQRTASGLVYIPQIAGVGERARSGDSVTVHYTGNVLYGKVFDSSRFRNQPFGVRIGRTQVIAGWTEGLQLMRTGERGTLIIPSNLAYGSRSQGEIPPNAILQFDIEVLNLTRLQ